MHNLVNLLGLSTTVLDFTEALSPFLIGLVCLMWFSAGMIVWSTVRHYWSAETSLALRPVLTLAKHLDAA